MYVLYIYGAIYHALGIYMCKCICIYYLWINILNLLSTSQNVLRDGTKAISFHANYRSGMHLKVKDLRDHGLWIYQDGKCQDFKPLI